MNLLELSNCFFTIACSELAPFKMFNCMFFQLLLFKLFSLDIPKNVTLFMIHPWSIANCSFVTLDETPPPDSEYAEQIGELRAHQTWFVARLTRNVRMYPEFSPSLVCTYPVTS